MHESTLPQVFHEQWAALVAELKLNQAAVVKLESFMSDLEQYTVDQHSPYMEGSAP